MGFSELLLIMIFGLIVFGPDELPKIARTVGRITYDVKKSINDVLNEVPNAVLNESKQSIETIPPTVDGENFQKQESDN